MSRRRKHGASPAPKSTPCRAEAATEEGGAAGEPGLRVTRSRRRERRRANAPGPDRNPEERYETPTRVLKMDLLSCTFSSPNDQDGQNDIFWDQNSPMTKQLGKGRKKQIPITDSDEISHIVNRIAPQDEKPMADSMLGMWIGATAIPCTPNVAKEQSRLKISSTKLKTRNREKELMKLAKQFDKNMEELDVIQEQDKNCDPVQIPSELETLHNCEDYVQTKSLCEVVPEIDNVTIKKPLKGNTGISVVSDSNNDQKPFDQNAEAAFNAIFDGSTQKCSGQLSQDPSDSFSNSDTTFGKKSVSKEEKIITNETLVTKNLPYKTVSLCPQVHTAIMPKSHVTPCPKEAEASGEHAPVPTTSDFEEDWESLLGDEPCSPDAEMLELFPAMSTQVPGHQGFSAVVSKHDKNVRTHLNFDDELRDSKMPQDLLSDTNSRQLIDAGGHRFSPNPSDQSSKLPHTRNKIKCGKSFNKVVIQDQIKDCVVASKLTNEHSHFKLTSKEHVLDKSVLNTRYTNEQKCGLSFDRSFKSSAVTKPLGPASVSNETSVDNPNQTDSSKLGSVLEDWNDPSFANEVIQACCQLETTWEADGVDDDVLYQACDDVERLTQQENRKDSEVPASTLEISNSKHGARSMSTASKRGSLLMQPKPSHLSCVSAQTSLTNNSQINKSMKMEKKDICRSYPDFSGATANVSVCSKNSNNQINSLHIFGDNIGVPMQVNLPRSALAERSSLNHVNTELATNKKLSTQHLPHSILAGEAQSSRNTTVKFSKFTFTKVKNCQFLSQFNQDCPAGSIPATKITQNLEKKKIDNLFGEADQQQSLMKCPESLKQSSKEEEEKHRKYSPEEIQRKRQEALVRRMAKARTSSVHSVPT